ncbi:uncharacterized protein LOC125114833 [Phacochoerus africanus]|uniref:uncharacterized protein LOC125114833 n=1 Tax=Phacochoerus africanus TaxID=41426 RepID=UPI001FD97142|nr:uncharacterized protein LOC125114833 [Phacochoerus africanus]
MAVASWGWLGSGGVPGRSLSPCSAPQPQDPPNWSHLFSCLMIQTEGAWAFPAGGLPRPRRRKNLPGPGSAWAQRRPDQSRGFNEENNNSQRGAGKGRSHFNFSLLAETNFSVKTMRNQGGASSPSSAALPRGKLCGQGVGGRWLERGVPRWGWLARAGSGGALDLSSWRWGLAPPPPASCAVGLSPLLAWVCWPCGRPHRGLDRGCHSAKVTVPSQGLAIVAKVLDGDQASLLRRHPDGSPPPHSCICPRKGPAQATWRQDLSEANDVTTGKKKKNHRREGERSSAQCKYMQNGVLTPAHPL